MRALNDKNETKMCVIEREKRSVGFRFLQETQLTQFFFRVFDLILVVYF